MIVVTPVRGWRRELLVVCLVGGTQEQLFDAFVAVNDAYDANGSRDEVNVSIVPVGVDRIGDWIDANVVPTWWERVTRRVRYSVHYFVREA